MSEISNTNQNIPLLPEDQARLDAIAGEIGSTDPNNLFILDLGTYLWLNEAVTTEQFQHALQAGGDQGVRFAVDLGGGKLWASTLGVVSEATVRANLEPKGHQLVRHSNPIEVPEQEPSVDQAAVDNTSYVISRRNGAADDPTTTFTVTGYDVFGQELWTDEAIDGELASTTFTLLVFAGWTAEPVSGPEDQHGTLKLIAPVGFTHGEIAA